MANPINPHVPYSDETTLSFIKEPKMICGVEPIKLSKVELVTYLLVLRSHNKVIEKHGAKSKLTMEKFREEFISGRLEVNLTAKDQTAIESLTLEVKTKLIAHHIRMVKNIAQHYCRCFNVTGKNRSDIAEEAVFGLMKALYAYTSDVKFSTFSHFVVTNTLKDYFRETHNGLSPVSKKGLSINNQIEEYRSSAGGSISFNRAVAELELSKKQIGDAIDARRSACAVTSMFARTPEEAELNSLLDKAIHEDNVNDEMELTEAYRTCDLTTLERAVMDAAIDPWHGWMVDLGREYPHDGGEHRTRQHIRMVLQRVQRKVQQQFEDMYSCKHEAAVA